MGTGSRFPDSERGAISCQIIEKWKSKCQASVSFTTYKLYLPTWLKTNGIYCSTLPLNMNLFDARALGVPVLGLLVAVLLLPWMHNPFVVCVWGGSYGLKHLCSIKALTLATGAGGKLAESWANQIKSFWKCCVNFTSQRNESLLANPRVGFSMEKQNRAGPMMGKGHLVFSWLPG